MKLSDAIEKGCLGRNQIRGAYRTPKGVCALGAAMVALGAESNGYFFSHVIYQVPCDSPLIFDEVQKWNDIDGLSFEEIVHRLRRMGL